MIPRIAILPSNRNSNNNNDRRPPPSRSYNIALDDITEDEAQLICMLRNGEIDPPDNFVSGQCDDDSANDNDDDIPDDCPPDSESF